MPAETPRKATGIPSLLHDVPVTKSTQRMCGMCFSLLLLTLLCCPLGLSTGHRLPGDRLGSGYRKINREPPVTLWFPRRGGMSHSRASGVWSLWGNRGQRLCRHLWARGGPDCTHPLPSLSCLMLLFIDCTALGEAVKSWLPGLYSLWNDSSLTLIFLKKYIIGF